MKTDMENEEQGAYSGSSRTRRPVLSLDKSHRRLPKNSKADPVKDDGQKAETKLTSLDVLLSMLQSHLGAIRDFGAQVLLCRHMGGGISVKLPEVNICDHHKMMHSGTTCPMC